MRVFTSPAELDSEMQKDDGFRFLPSHGPAGFVCSDCGETKPLNTDNGGGTGYARDNAGQFVCYECCGRRDVEDMKASGRGVLYLCMNRDNGPHHYVSNWPGTLSIKVANLRRGRHNLAGNRYDVTFTGPDGKRWRGTQYGDNTQICRVRRCKD